MTRLEKLRVERAIVSNLTMIPFSAKDMISAHMAREIKAIEEYGSDNPACTTENLTAIKNILDLILT